jgi:hypothetical protein
MIATHILQRTDGRTDTHGQRRRQATSQDVNCVWFDLLAAAAAHWCGFVLLLSPCRSSSSSSSNVLLALLHILRIDDAGSSREQPDRISSSSKLVTTQANIL